MTRRTGGKALLNSSFSLVGTQSLARLVAPLLRAQCVSIRQFTLLLRKAAVELEQSKFQSEKVNKARIAFSTGLTRGTVSHLLGQVTLPPDSDIQAVVGAWRREADFLSDNGCPADLPLFGRGKTFERLAKRYGKGIPVRAILDELLDRGAIALLPAQSVRLKESFPGSEYEYSVRLATQLEAQVNEALRARLQTEKSASDSAPNPRRTHFKRRRT